MTDHLALGFFTSSGVGKTGITVTVDVYKISDNSKVVNNQAATEVAGGLYKYLYQTSTLDDYAFVFKTADTTVDAQQVAGFVPVQVPRIDAAVSSRLETTSYTAPDNAGVAAIKAKTDNLPAAPASSVDVLAIKAKTDNLPAAPASASDVAAVPAAVWGLAEWGELVSQIWSAAVGSATVVGPAVNAGGVLTIYRGDDYLAADGRSMDWTIDAVGAGASGAVSMLGKSYAVTFPNATTARLELTHAETALMGVGSFDYRLVVTDADGHIATVRVGQVRTL